MEKRVAALAVCIAAAAPWLMGQGPETLLLAIAAAGACWLGFRGAGWLNGDRRISRVSWRAEGGWCLTDARGREYAAALRSDTRVAAGLVWLCWNTQLQVDAGAGRAGKQGGIRSMLLTSGDIPRSQLRRLCVRLRLSGGAASGLSLIGQPRAPAI